MTFFCDIRVWIALTWNKIKVTTNVIMRKCEERENNILLV